ncbi:unnamed protein product, partial [Effrenium voratum]
MADHVPDSELQRPPRIFLDRLSGGARIRALGAAKRLQGATTLGQLGSEVQAAAQEVAEGVVEVTAPQPGAAAVILRPEHGCHVVAAAGADAGSGAGLPSALAVKVEGSEDTLRISGEGKVCLGSEALLGTVRVSPVLSGRFPVVPSLELGCGLGGRTSRWQELRGQLCFCDPLGRHSLKLAAKSRESKELGSLKDLDFDKLRSSKASVAYEFLHLHPSGHVALSAELCGLLGDVQAARCEASCRHSGRFGHSARWRVSAGLGLAAPLLKDSLPFQERFFLGGASGQALTQRLMAFEPQGVGIPTKSVRPENVHTGFSRDKFGHLVARQFKSASTASV